MTQYKLKPRGEKKQQHNTVITQQFAKGCAGVIRHHVKKQNIIAISWKTHAAYAGLRGNNLRIFLPTSFYIFCANWTFSEQLVIKL